jgi:phosphoserine phosphatase
MSIVGNPAVASFLEKYSRIPEPPLAVFDCDGTVIKGDIGEAMLYFQIEHFLFKRSPALVWDDHPERNEIDRLYRSLLGREREARNAAPEFPPFADYLLSWYFGQIDDGKVEKACADIVKLFAGHTLAEVRRIAADTFQMEMTAPISHRRLGSRTLPRGIRFIRESIELVMNLREAGFRIWAVSGSSTWSVEPVFHSLGVPAERVVGIDLAVENGILAATPREPVPIREKKVSALKARTTVVPSLVASDSRNDIPLFLYSGDLKLLVNSHNRESDLFFSSSNLQRDASWVVIEKPTTDDGDGDTWQMFR